MIACYTSHSIYTYIQYTECNKCLDLFFPHPGPISVKLNDPDSTDAAPFPSFLPLDIFTDMEFDCRTPGEWLAMGMENGCRKPVPGTALLPAWDLVDKCKCDLTGIKV